MLKPQSQRRDTIRRYVGIDVAQEQCALCIVDDAGTILFEGTCATDPDEIVRTINAEVSEVEKIVHEFRPIIDLIDAGTGQTGFTGGPQKNPARFMVGKDAGQKAEASCRNCSSQQDGAGDLGNAHQRRRLPGSRTCRGGLTQRHKETENKKGIVQEVDPSNGQNDRIDLDRENQFGSVSASALRRDLGPTR